MKRTWPETILNRPVENSIERQVVLAILGVSNGNDFLEALEQENYNLKLKQ